MNLSDIRNAKAVQRKQVNELKKSRPAQVYLTQLQKLYDSIKSAKDTGASKEYLAALLSEGKDAIHQTYLANQLAENERLSNELNKIKEKVQKDYEKDYQLKDFRLKNFERRMSLIGDKELRDMVHKYGNNELNISDPIEVEIIAAETVKRNLTDDDKAENPVPMIDYLRTAMQRKQYDRIELQTDEGKAIDLEMKLNVLTEQNGIYLADEKGRTAPMTFDELWDLMDDSDEGGQDE